MTFTQECRCHFTYAAPRLYVHKNRYPRKQERIYNLKLVFFYKAEACE